MNHLRDCFRRFDEGKRIAERPGEVLAALWFHDAIYNARSSNNEADSAGLAKRVLRGAGAPAATTRRVERLIMATRHAAIPRGRDAALVVDIDLSILGAPPARFRRYEKAIRREYAWVPKTVFRHTRCRILEGFLGRPAIYLTRLFFERYEAQARRNLRRSIANLETTWRG
jgi:predicted metal-dependent HD superfamily phosphohydrolase